jgi:hypothetical protein
LCVVELVSTLRQEQLRQSNLECAEHRTCAAVVHDEVDQRQHRGLGHEPLHVHVVRHLAEPGWLAFRPDRHQDVHIQRCDLGDRPVEHLDSAE